MRLPLDFVRASLEYGTPRDQCRWSCVSQALRDKCRPVVDRVRARLDAHRPIVARIANYEPSVLLRDVYYMYEDPQHVVDFQGVLRLVEVLYRTQKAMTIRLDDCAQDMLDSLLISVTNEVRCEVAFNQPSKAILYRTGQRNAPLLSEVDMFVIRPCVVEAEMMYTERPPDLVVTNVGRGRFRLSVPLKSRLW